MIPELLCIRVTICLTKSLKVTGYASGMEVCAAVCPRGVRVCRCTVCLRCREKETKEAHHLMVLLARQ